jgi:hypothetical protein
MSNKHVKRLLENFVNEIINNSLITEAEPADEPEAATDTPDSGEDSSADDVSDSTDGIDLGSTGDDSGSTDESGDDTVDGESTDSDSDAEDFDLGGGGGGGFSLSGGGGGAGSGGGLDLSDDSDTVESDDSTDTDTETSEEPVDDTLPEDPNEFIIKSAKDMLKNTSDHNQILASIKANIQNKLNSWEDAEQIVYDLWETDEPILKMVASKLLMFVDQK